MVKLGLKINSVKMTTSIAVLVMTAIIGSIALVSGAIFVNLHEQAIQAGKAQQTTNLATAATILEHRIPGSVLSWSPEGTMGTFQSWAIPRSLNDTEIIDSVTRVTNQDASIYVFDPATQNLVSATTSVLGADGKRVSAMPIDAYSAAYSPILAKEQYVGRVEVNGIDYFGALHPIQKVGGELLGAIFVGTPMAHVEASANSALATILAVGGAVTLILSSLGFVASLLITRPIPRLAASMDKIAQGDYGVEVPYTSKGNEVGAMARAVEVFRENARQVVTLTAQERMTSEQRRADHAAMMQDLQQAFGRVVDAAVSGDFSQRVDVTFPDPELNNLAASINNLVDNVDRGLTETGAVLAAMARTDLTKRMAGDYQGAFGRLRDDINELADTLTRIVRGLRTSSKTLKTATGELLAGANDLNDRTAKQSATIEETAAAMQQLADTVEENARRAEAASENARTVSATATEGGDAMHRANDAMQRIADSSSKIGNIIGLIDDIAFQTNLLALNASVEAARAGEAGEGFAVVALEVRRLAQSSAQASSDIKALVEQSGLEVVAGTKLVGEAADKLLTMLGSVRQSSDLISAIADATKFQAAGIREVCSAVSDLDKMNQHNAALVEQTNAAVEQAEFQAADLDQMVEIFAIDGKRVADNDVRKRA